MDTALILPLIADLLIIAGVLIFAVAVLGLFKFSDVYTRISAVGTAAGLGISLIIIGVFCHHPSWMNLIKLVLILFLQLATSSIGTMAIARSAYLTGSTMQPGFFDHLAEDQQDPQESVRSDQDEPASTPRPPSETDHDDTVPGAF